MSATKPLKYESREMQWNLPLVSKSDEPEWGQTHLAICMASTARAHKSAASIHVPPLPKCHADCAPQVQITGPAYAAGDPRGRVGQEIWRAVCPYQMILPEKQKKKTTKKGILTAL